MPHKQRPRRGSMQYAPRKRAKRIYPTGASSNELKESKPMAFAGWKAGMTHIKFVDSNSKSPTYGKTIVKAVTIIESPSLLVCGIKFYSKNFTTGAAILLMNFPRPIMLYPI